MKKFTLIVLSVILAAAMLASCTQYRVIWIPGMDDQNTPSTSQSAKDTFSLIDALDAQLPKDIEEVMAAPDAVQGLTRTDSAGTISMASRSWEATYSATFSFNEYPVAGYGTIKTEIFTAEECMICKVFLGYLNENIEFKCGLCHNKSADKKTNSM